MSSIDRLGQTFDDKIIEQYYWFRISRYRDNNFGGQCIYYMVVAKSDSTTNELVMKVSNDNGKTLGPLLRLTANGTRGQ